jgi:UDP-N-acetylglucosamine 2-epimerase (non-hydrolysing)
MRVLTIAGTRPEWVRLSRIIPKLDKACDHILVDTGQNYDKNLRDVFLEELDIRQPDYELGAVGSFGEQLGILSKKLEAILLKEKPDVFLVLGDTNSSLGAIIAKRLGIKVVHMEAGNRCYDDKVPEEVNRRIIDHSSDILLPYTERSRQNLLDEGIHSSRIYVTGNPILEVMNCYPSTRPETKEPYYLATLHRQENVDDPERLSKFIQAFSMLDSRVLWSVHPRTKARLGSRVMPKNVKVIEPVGFKKFVGLEKYAKCVLTDSGTVQEECAILATPVVTLRDSTERPETIEAGCNFITGCDPERIVKGVELSIPSNRQAPEEYFVKNVSDTVVKIVLGYHV